MNLKQALLSRTGAALAGLFTQNSNDVKRMELAQRAALNDVKERRPQKKQDYYVGDPGRPGNVFNTTSAGRRVWKHPGVVISSVVEPKMLTRSDGSVYPMMSKLKLMHGAKPYVVQLRRGVGIEHFRDAMNEHRRRAMGRFVGPFNFPARAAA